MTSRPENGYSELHERTVFAVWVKSPPTWDFKQDKPRAFWRNLDAKVAMYSTGDGGVGSGDGK